jgi:hypothetical protein
MRMLEFRRRLGFLDEATLTFGVGDQLRRENFEGNLAVELHIDGTVHDTHAASAELFQNLVMRKDPTNHRGTSRWLAEEGESLLRSEKSKR